MSKQNTWGGPRSGAGRPKKINRKNLVIDASDGEHRAILDSLSTRQRTQALVESSDFLFIIEPLMNIETQDLIDNAEACKIVDEEFENALSVMLWRLADYKRNNCKNK